VINKYIATAKIVDPSAVASRATSEGFTAHKGAIFVSIPEMGFEEPNLIYCRYGLSIPYLKIQKDWRVWVEPTIGEDQRFCFTGIVDCGSITPADADQAIIQFAAQMIYAGTDGVIHLSSKTAAEAFVLGGKLKTYIDTYIDSYYNTHIHTTTATVGGSATPGTISPPVTPAVKPTDIYSTKIMGE
jgi:hypothetical protein